MKRIFFAFAMLISLSSIAQWGPWEKIEGNGHIKKETRSAANYTAIASSGSWDVMVAYGDNSSIQVEGDENLLAYIETSVEDGKLTIKSKKGVNLRSKNKITIYVALTKLTGVSLSGSGDILGEGKFNNDGKTEFRLSGSGSIKMAFNKIKNVEVGISGSGNIRLSGSASMVAARISGSGNADCSELICDDASAHISGSGNVKLNANTSIDASISGSGNVSYRGAASDVKKHVSGSGRLVKA
ncbi:MAG: head GIN domain-containing protein [Bacteroidota bacterium]